MVLITQVCWSPDNHRIVEPAELKMLYMVYWYETKGHAIDTIEKDPFYQATQW